MRRKRKRKQIISTVILCILLVLVAAGMVYLGSKMKEQEKGQDLTSDSSVVTQEEEVQQQSQIDEELLENEITETPTPEPTQEVQQAEQISSEGLNSSYAYLVRRDDMAVLMDLAGEERIYPASMTKIMTAILAIEKLQNLDETITVPEEIFASLTEQGASVAGFYPYEKVTVRSLLYGVLLPSGADACLTLAQKISGSEEEFVKLMNDKAAELGMSGTQFANCTGLHQEEHYSTCQDIAKLMNYSLQNDTFRTVISSSKYTTEALSGHAEGITVYSTMFGKFNDNQFSTTLDNGAVIEGGKTGYTDEAGLCLASFAKYSEKEYILVTAGAMTFSGSDTANVRDAITVYGRLTE
ncbi:MAG: D-alanyl-D-alanine carboxypeptidase [Fusicatenibacter sp.]|nr:serine hydrolase [Lachnospiraceae bacterium]MDY2937765.1 D-alanyl-D-alanine carboxypeptidase [Fusicatenibacter sp.]